MSNATIAEQNGSAVAVKGMEVKLTNPEPKPVELQAKQQQSKKAKTSDKKLVETVAIQETYVEKYNCILRYEGHKIFIMQSKGDKQLLLGVMTDKGIDRNVHLSANTQIMDLITVANRKFSPVSKAQQEERKVQQMNIARAAIASLF